MKRCSYPECGRPHYSRELCQTHYKQRRSGKELRPIQAGKAHRPPVNPCTGPDCQNWGNYGGVCWSHREQQKAGKELQPLRETHEKEPGSPKVRKPRERGACAAEFCSREEASLGLCAAHYRQSRTGDGVLRPIHVPTYRYVSKDGYVRLMDPAHPNAGTQGRVLEHTKVMSDLLGRPLWPDENVHHINGVKDDNRPENLQLWCTKQPKGQRIEDKVEWAKEILRRYEPEALIT